MRFPLPANARRHRLAAIPACIGLLISSLLGPVPASAGPAEAPSAQVQVALSPASGPAGTRVTVTGSGYVPGGYPGTLRWGDTTMMTFPIASGGAFSIGFTVPDGATPGKHKVTVCANCGDGEFEQIAWANFVVTSPPTMVPVKPPTSVPMPLPLPPPTEIPTICESLGLDAEARVVDFESFSAGTVLDDRLGVSHGVVFDDSVMVVAPPVRPRSGGLAGSSRTTEFGSVDMPIRMLFPEGMRAVGMFVGLEDPVEASGQVTAVLEAYGYAAGSSTMSLLGTATETFPAERTDIEKCVAFVAAPGSVIVRATMDYESSDGRSLLELRLVDDITLLPARDPLPADQPPTVEIEIPVDGSFVLTDTFDLRATIEEDRGLLQVSASLFSASHGDGLRLAPIPLEDATHYRVFHTFDAARYLVPDEETRLIVRAVDTAGQVGEDEVHIRYLPPPELDLEIVTVEATQATQCLDASVCRAVPLIAGRPTLLRVYVRAAAGGPTADVSGELCYWFSGETVGECIRRLEPMWPVEVTSDPDPVTAHRGDLRRTLNFLLPDDAVRRSGTLYVQVRLNPQHNPEECCYGNNELWPVWTILPEERVDVAYIPVSLAGTTASLDQRWRLVDWLYRAYPVTRVQVWQVEGGAPMVVNPLDVANAVLFGGTLWDAILYELGWVNAWCDDPVDGLRYFGMVPDTALSMSGGIGGQGEIPGTESAAIVPTTEIEEGVAARYLPDESLTISTLMIAGHIAAEELGHNFGRRHATSGCSAANPDPGYPVAEGRLDEWGTDVRQVLACGAPGPVIGGGTGAGTVDPCNSALYNPAGAHDYMGYCDVFDRAWTSAYTYRAMISAIGRVALPGGRQALASPAGSGSETAMVLVGGGIVAPERLTLLSPLYLLPALEAPEVKTMDGPYRAVLVSATGDRLAEIPFGPIETSNEEPGVSGVVRLRLPWQPGTSIVVFEHDGREIGRVTASAQAPQVRLTSPNGGETWNESGTKRIRWEADDADGDALLAVVQYSVDGGETWRAVAVDVEGDQVEVDLANLTGTDQARVRVTVSDGFHTASDASDATFTVEGKPPEVFLASPAEGAEYPYGWPVLLEGYFTDREDGATLNGTNAAWASSLDGPLGQGDWLLVDSLSPGRHRLSLTVRDSQGMTGMTEVNIVILNPDGSAPPLPPDIPWGWILGIASAGLVGMGLLVFAVMDASRARGRARRRG